VSLGGSRQRRTEEIVFKPRLGARDSTVLCGCATPRQIFVPKRMRGAGSDHHSFTRTQDALLSACSAVERSFQNLDALIPARRCALFFEFSAENAEIVDWLAERGGFELKAT
jgi:hypothetical protein